jgi:hypothetical protein
MDLQAKLSSDPFSVLKNYTLGQKAMLELVRGQGKSSHRQVCHNLKSLANCHLSTSPSRGVNLRVPSSVRGSLWCPGIMVTAVYTNLRIHFLSASLQQNISSFHSITVSTRLLIIIYPCSALHLLCWDPNFIHLNLNLSWNLYCTGVDGAKWSSDNDDYITTIPGGP